MRRQRYGFSLRLFQRMLLALFIPILASVANPFSTAHSASSVLHAEGADLIYQGQKIILKGTNFDNINALGANIGTNNVNDIEFAEADYAELARQGGNHVRLGLSFSWYQQNKSLFFQKMDEQVAFARKYGIFLLFNMFTTPGDCYEGYGNSCGFWSNSGEQQQLQSFWVEMAGRYKSEPAVAGYDLLNEPTPPNSCTQWFPIAQRIRDAVAPITEQLVFIETCSDPGNDLAYNSPPTGANIVYEVHDYSPMDMSHDMFSPGSVYPGTANEWFGSCYVDKNVFATGQGCPQMNIRETYGLNWAQSNNVPIYIGEWGAASVLNGYAQYHQDKAELYRDWGVNHAHYTWKHQTIKTGGFYQWGMYSDNPSQTDDPAKLNAVKIAWAGAIRPNFGSGTISTPLPATAQPTSPIQPTSPAQPTAIPTNTRVVPTATRLPSGGTLPVPWQHNDIGSPGLSGDASYINGSFTVIAAGTDIWNTADEFHFVYQNWTGDGTLTARITRLDNTYEWAKAGLMFRENTSGPSRHVSLFLTAAAGLAFQPRTVTGGTMIHRVGTSGAAPIWLRVSRSGDTFTAYSSTNGSSWVFVAQETLSLPANLVVGLAVSSHDSSQRTTAVFDHVTLAQDGVIPSATPSIQATIVPSQQPTARPTIQATATSVPTSIPNPPATPGSGSFYRAINVHGPEVSLGLHRWDAGDAVGFSSNGFGQENPWMSFDPYADDDFANMLQDWDQHWAFDIRLANVPNGKYAVYIYAVQDWNDPNAEQVSVKVENQATKTYMPGAAGSWQKLGPFNVTVADSSLNIRTNGGVMNIAGIEVFRR